MNKNDEIELEILDNGINFEGISRVDNKVVFVPDAIKGEKVLTKIIKVNKNFCIGKIEKIIEESSKRQTPFCSVYKRCGGCSAQHIKYRAQLEIKYENVKNTLANKNLYVIISEGLATASLKITGGFYQMKNEIKHTAHSTYRCEYHIVFAPKYRRKEIYGQLKKDIGEIIRKLCNEKKVEIIEAEACPDHIHMLVSVPPYLSIAQFMGFLKGKSTLMIFDRHANLKYKYGSRNFWCRGYYVDTVGRNERVIQEYIKRQLEEDRMHDQISMSEYIDPFTGIKNK